MRLIGCPALQDKQKLVTECSQDAQCPNNALCASIPSGRSKDKTKRCRMKEGFSGCNGNHAACTTGACSQNKCVPNNLNVASPCEVDPQCYGENMRCNVRADLGDEEKMCRVSAASRPRVPEGMLLAVHRRTPSYSSSCLLGYHLVCGTC